ncbi:beta-propeller fold lactonase family protein [Chelativorans sp. AA-79]|uniref:lactonase family protein n=1 Tax=Chelativorans sp. AA-79 TaxID=3028735 RepID=UPI0023F95356|nr:beta-propeller fold lactonase family protein [Chelativorans sp. AA-79]WEX12413.1 beta-propeller fold lactonase family protein [Chelativorans sp. AA-79]
MATFEIPSGERLLVAGRGAGQSDGLHQWTFGEGGWRGVHLATVDQLASLAPHRSLAVVYGSSGTGDEGFIHGWRLDGERADRIGGKSSEGLSPCHVAVDPEGRFLVVTNYRTSALGVQRLTPQGGFDGEIDLIPLSGRGLDPERQSGPRPHQTLFHQGRVYVVDLGADRVREFEIDKAATGEAGLRETGATPVPPGTGPRHGVWLPDGRLAIAAELASTIVLGRPGIAAEEWGVTKSTTHTGPAKTRFDRNYPGDIRCSADGRYAYLANRGYDTIATFDVSGPLPVMVSEIDAGVAWPQHLLIHGDHLLVAGWESSRVVAMPLVDGLPAAAEPVFDCGGAGWLTLMRY